mmetsp:Transcript_119722/g.284422  ORF Transcript_119722/g.284422 Transcript_119722/m.284422 type:complete len:173 (-) Transcript_119722:47-565(-)
MEAGQPLKSSAPAWGKKRTKRYLETVWPRSYWNTGPVRFEPRCYRSSLPPRTGKSRRPARVRTAWEDDMKPKSEAGAVSARVGAATVVPLETDTQSESSSSKDSQEEVPLCHTKLPQWYSDIDCCNDEILLLKDKRRQEVYGKMEQLGSLKLIWAQTKGSESFRYADLLRPA